MTFGEKLRQLRVQNGLTQEQLAAKIYVTRTAVSKWETDRGYPSLDSLKMLSDMFGVSLDSLISSADIQNNRTPVKKRKRVFYIISVLCLAAAALLLLLACFFNAPYLNIAGVGAAFMYALSAVLSRRPADSAKDNKTPARYALSRAAIAAVIAVAAITTLVGIYV